MFGSQILDVAIGIAFVYLLLSILCTAANEMVAGLLALRARSLAEGISNLLADSRIKGMDELLYKHPLIKGLYRGNKKPSYIPSRSFALAFLDGIAPFEGKAEKAVWQIKDAVGRLSVDSEMKRLLSIFLQQSGDDFSKLQAAVETWFNDSMTRVSGWYKRQSQVITVIFAILIAGASNADTLSIVKKLYTDSTLRASIVAQAQARVGQKEGSSGSNSQTIPNPPSSNSPGTPTTAENKSKETYKETLEAINQLGLPLGWEAVPKHNEWILKIIGLLLTIMAISLGAPFWFDTLSRITKIRSSGATPAESAKATNEKRPA